MADTATIDVTRRFLKLMAEGEPPSKVDLTRILDELAMAYHNTPNSEPADDDRVSPEADPQERYRAIAERFPDLGYYAVADPTEALNKKPLVGDAIDDLADISSDLEEVIWRFETLGAEDAHWYFKMLYQIHWGWHLRELALYLHARTW